MQGQVGAEQRSAQCSVILAREEQTRFGAVCAGNRKEAVHEVVRLRQGVGSFDGAVQLRHSTQMPRKRDEKQRERRQALLTVDDVGAARNFSN